jgi:hypothetical protein
MPFQTRFNFFILRLNMLFHYAKNMKRQKNPLFKFNIFFLTFKGIYVILLCKEYRKYWKALE